MALARHKTISLQYSRFHAKDYTWIDYAILPLANPWSLTIFRLLRVFFYITERPESFVPQNSLATTWKQIPYLLLFFIGLLEKITTKARVITLENLLLWPSLSFYGTNTLIWWCIWTGLRWLVGSSIGATRSMYRCCWFRWRIIIIMP